MHLHCCTSPRDLCTRWAPPLCSALPATCLPRQSAPLACVLGDISPPRSIALPQQAALTIILLLYNGQLCQRNAAVQLAYSALQLNATRRASTLLGRLAALPLWQRWARATAAGRSCAAAVLAAPAHAREAVRAACVQAASVARAAHAEHAPAAPSLQHGSQLCLRYQPGR